MVRGIVPFRSGDHDLTATRERDLLTAGKFGVSGCDFTTVFASKWSATRKKTRFQDYNSKKNLGKGQGIRHAFDYRTRTRTNISVQQRNFKCWSVDSRYTGKGTKFYDGTIKVDSRLERTQKNRLMRQSTRLQATAPWRKLHAESKINYSKHAAEVPAPFFFAERVINVWNYLPSTVNYVSLSASTRFKECGFHPVSKVCLTP